MEVDDPEAHYIIQAPCVMCWLSDEDARLIGEKVYEMEAGTVVKLKPEEVIASDDLWGSS